LLKDAADYADKCVRSLELHRYAKDLERPAVLVKAGRIITPEELVMKRLRRMKQNVITSSRLHDEAARKGSMRGRWAMVTLTYRDDAEWAPDQVGKFINRVRDYASRRGFKARYVWVLELTKRYRPHYHALVWVPRGYSFPKPDKQGWWRQGLTRIEYARNPVGYMAKYGSKGSDAETQRFLPKGARLSGNGGLTKDARTELRWWKLPKWVREVFDSICDVARRDGGGYLNRDTGEFLASPWRVVFHGGALVLCEVIEPC
jgi:hypothetical protein